MLARTNGLQDIIFLNFHMPCSELLNERINTIFDIIDMCKCNKWTSWAQ